MKPTKGQKEKEKKHLQKNKGLKKLPDKQTELHIVAGCLHFPAHNERQFDGFCQLVQDLSPTGIHLIGDAQDLLSLSGHDKGNVIHETLSNEYYQTNKALDQLDEALPSSLKYKNYLYGNHEDRYFREMKKIDSSKFGSALLSPTDGARLKQRGYHVEESYQNGYITLGKHIDLIHGYWTTQNASKKHLDMFKRSLIFAHTHKIGCHYDADKAAFNIGWMGDKNNKAFNYASRPTKMQWQNGFAVVRIDEEGYFHFQQITYFNNRFYYGNKRY